MLNLPEEQVRELYIKKIEDITNTTFDRNNLPAGVEIALFKLMSLDPENLGVASEKIADMSQTFRSTSEIYSEIASDLQEYSRPHLFKKGKRAYKDGR